jgi:hypothetical protein
MLSPQASISITKRQALVNLCRANFYKAPSLLLFAFAGCYNEKK